MMTTPEERAWDSYWQETAALAARADEDGASIWDVEAEKGAALDLPRFQPVVDPALPFLDLGCGSGIQTRYLARHFSRVIGADVSAAAVALAAAQGSLPNLEYRVLDVLDVEDARAFHAEVGDVNVYMRTLLHLVQPGSRAVFAEAVATLLGERGTLCLHELGADAEAYLGGWIQRNGMPVRLERILRTGIQPGTVDRDHVLSMFPPDRFTVVADGAVSSAPVEVRVVGSPPAVAAEPWAPPAYFMVLQPQKR